MIDVVDFVVGGVEVVEGVGDFSCMEGVEVFFVWVWWCVVEGVEIGVLVEVCVVVSLGVYLVGEGCVVV